MIRGSQRFCFCCVSVCPGGGVFGMLNKCNRFGRNPVVLLGLITHFMAFYLIFLNIASDAPIAPEEGTHLQAYITPRYTAGLTQLAHKTMTIDYYYNNSLYFA